MFPKINESVPDTRMIKWNEFNLSNDISITEKFNAVDEWSMKIDLCKISINSKLNWSPKKINIKENTLLELLLVNLVTP